MMGKHTPGPWHIENRYADYVAIEGLESPDGYCPEIAAIELDEHGGHLSPEQKANANLIAAVPDLLAVAERLVEIGELANNEYDKWDQQAHLFAMVERLQNLYDEAQAAIAKAKGETS